MVGSVWSPTSVSARKDSPAASVRKESEEHEGTVRKTASWSTSLTWRLTCWTSPVILYKKQGRMITRSSPVGRLNVTEAFQSLPSGHHPQSPTAPHLILLSHHCSFSWATGFDLHASLHHLHSHPYAQIHTWPTHNRVANGTSMRIAKGVACWRYHARVLRFLLLVWCVKSGPLSQVSRQEDSQSTGSPTWDQLGCSVQPQHGHWFVLQD